jgi:Na+-transporting NADH:ubiquinone oxidoreductase subunit NqrA
MSDELEEAYTEDGQRACSECLREYIDKHTDLLTEAKYQGKEVPLGKPMAGDVKKSKVYVKNPTTGNVVKVNFGDKNMRIKKSNPNRRRSFRARHHCENPGPKTKARYWSCRAW